MTPTHTIISVRYCQLHWARMYHYELHSQEITAAESRDWNLIHALLANLTRQSKETPLLNLHKITQ